MILLYTLVQQVIIRKKGADGEVNYIYPIMTSEDKSEKSKMIFKTSLDLFKSRNKIIDMNLHIDCLSLFYESLEQKSELPTLEVIIVDDDLKNFEKRKVEIDKVLKFETVNKIKYTHEYPTTDHSYQ